ncbi:NifB/NifX family molybdenum-iron cluster-binding protein [Uliginosibacterium sp. TH139]|uniref:NifB/NifX family molybdenum-iron cluster-binding protein n=1 Tax=Uliginosibacterium sp. TH139 TaxID=2067453 RepID=UPI000C7AA4CB|nr:NifB/NifX family molybdenum-iron cluster-binding protein [Uliginosibacterium sp. TH139]PLK48224.1 nitrogen fixation protein NifX [Uliginosibacterium sp. TH139]
MTLPPIAPCSGLADPASAKSPSPLRKLTLAWSATDPEPGTLRIAFASRDRLHVDQHFGAAEGFVLYTVDAERARLAGVMEFAAEAMDGNENKLAEKIDALSGCAAMYCLAVGGSAVRQLLAAGIQPMKLDEAAPIDGLLLALSEAIRDGGVPWIAKALRQDGDASRFERMAEEGWQE